MKTTFRIPAIGFALAAALAASMSLGRTSAVATAIQPVAMQAGGGAAEPGAFGRRFANAFPTAEAGFAARRPVVVDRS